MRNVHVFSFESLYKIIQPFKFKNNISFIRSTNTSIQKHLELLEQIQPQCIIGIGIYSGRDKNKNRIEKTCTNKFRNNYIEHGELMRKKIPCFLSENQYTKISNGIGNSWCNYISYNIIRLIELEKLNSKYTFLHVPARMNDKEKAVESLLSKLL